MSRYRVYWNSHKRVFSIQTKTARGWRVWKHADMLMLDNVEFVVNEKAQRRCRLHRRKNVHAYLVAEFCTFRFEPGFGILPIEEGERVQYRPFDDDHFNVMGHPVTWASVVQCRVASGHPILTAWLASDALVA